MNRILLFSFVLFSLAAKAQVALPYFTGFDDATQQTGWTEYKKAATTFSHWGYGPVGFSAPTAITHDYSPSTGITLTDNWFVSPAFLIPGGGKLDSVRYRFSGFSQPQADDTVALYLLNGAQDPGLASSKLLLVDFRNADYVTDNTYRVKTDITLPATAGNCYIAVRYRNADCSSRWLTVNFDNIAIRGTGSAGLQNLGKKDDMHIYPNPSSGMFTLESALPVDRVEIFNANGDLIPGHAGAKTSMTVDLSTYPKGLYFIQMHAGGNTYTKRIVLE